jgi:hypothetical protein
MNTNDWIGSVGVGLILLAFFLTTFKWMSGQSRIYFFLNATGAALACLASYLIDYWPFVVLEGTWMLVSLIGFFRPKQKDHPEQL